jgi:hypothetical protein
MLDAQEYALYIQSMGFTAADYRVHTQDRHTSDKLRADTLLALEELEKLDHTQYMGLN